MEICKFYTVKSIVTQSNENTGTRHRAPSVTRKLPYCQHPQSPVTLFDINSTFGGGGLLKCGGDLAKCQVKTP